MIAQEFARSPSEYLAKIAKPGLSDLVALRDAEFYEGLTRMEEAATDQAGPVMEPVDLFLFRKAANTPQKPSVPVPRSIST